MYYQVISQCTQSLKNLETCLDKAEKHAAAKKFDVGVLMTSRLAPDMQHFIYQVQSACDYVKAAAAWLSGQMPPKHEDNEQTVDELAPASGRPSLSQRACRRRNTRARPNARSNSPGRPARSMPPSRFPPSPTFSDSSPRTWFDENPLYT
jgi:hypothetical protein